MKIIPAVRDCALTLASAVVAVSTAQTAREAGRKAARPRDRGTRPRVPGASSLPSARSTRRSVSQVQAYHSRKRHPITGAWVCSECRLPFPCRTFLDLGVAIIDAELKRPIVVQAYGNEVRRRTFG